MKKFKSPDDKIKNLVSKLLSGKINSEDLKELNEWYDSFDSNQEINVFSSKPEDFNSAKKKLLNRINEERFATPKIFKYLNQYRNVAAIIILFGLLAAAAFLYIPINSNDNQIVWNEIRVKEGHKKILTLSDNSKIFLNSGSYFKYPTKFSSSQREIYLEGEAYFEIVHNKHQKFVVNTPKISTTVLGTKFNIHAFNNEELSVALVEGSVKVSRIEETNEENSVFLKPLEQYVLSSNDEISIVKSFNVKEAIGWKNNEFVFNNKPLEYILNVLSRTYGVKFVLSDDNFAKRKITANFNDASVSTIIKSIKKLTSLQHSVHKENENEIIMFY